MDTPRRIPPLCSSGLEPRCDRTTREKEINAMRWRPWGDWRELARGERLRDDEVKIPWCEDAEIFFASLASFSSSGINRLIRLKDTLLTCAHFRIRLRPSNRNGRCSTQFCLVYRSSCIGRGAAGRITCLSTLAIWLTAATS